MFAILNFRETLVHSPRPEFRQQHLNLLFLEVVLKIAKGVPFLTVFGVVLIVLIIFWMCWHGVISQCLIVR